MSGKHDLPDGSQPDDQLQASQPSSANGDQHGVVQPSAPAPVAPGGDFASAEAPAAADAPVAPRSDGDTAAAAAAASELERRNRDHGAGGKFVLGNQAAKTHGLNQRQPPLAIDASSAAARAAVILKVFESTARHAVRLAEAADRHALRPRDGAALLQALDRLVAIEPQVRSLAAPADCGAEADADLPDRWPVRMAQIFASQPDAFTEFLTLLFAADMAACGPLRSIARLTLAHVEPQAVPQWRGGADDDDTVLL